MSASGYHQHSRKRKSTILTSDEERKFKKRKGTTNKGTEYEYLYVAFLILKLTFDDDVVNFYLSSNDEQFGDFDDVVVEITYKDHTETYAIQLKHLNNKTLGRDQLTARTKKKKDFSIEKYYKSFTENSKLQQDVKMILFTNTVLNTEEVKQINFSPSTVDLVPKEENKLLNTSLKQPSCHTFNTNQAGSSMHDHFCEQFCLYTSQADVTQLKENIREILKKNFTCDELVVRQYVDFIREWCMEEEEKPKLDKFWMTRFLALCVLSPHVKPLSFNATRSATSKEKLFREVVSEFDVNIIDQINYKKISYLWSDAINELTDVSEVAKVSGKYLLYLKVFQVEDLFNEDPTKVNKMMWLLGKCPLVVQECPQVYRTFKIFCENLIMLKDPTKAFDESSEIISGQKTFQKLSDLKGEPELYEKILTTFTYSIEGQKETALKHLVEISEETESLITSDQVVKMLEGPLSIGNQKEVLPPSHIERNMTKILIHVEFLKKCNPKTSIVLVSNVKDCEQFNKLLPSVKMKEISVANETEVVKPSNRRNIYICREHISLKQFTAAFKDKPRTQIYHFRYFDNRYLEWIRSGCSEQRFKELEKLRLNDEFTVYTLHQSELFKSEEQDVNIICAEPGMGKSTLMKSLKTNTSSTKWTVVIYARNHFAHFMENDGTDVEKFKEYIFTNLGKKCSELDQEVFKTMLKLNHIQVVWDGLDEVSDNTLGKILTMVQTLKKSGVQQWLTSRNNLKTTLENRLGSFSRNIKTFDDQEQKHYIKERLDISAHDLSATFNKIKKNIMSFPNYEILGIPLQIYMLTELFLSDKEKYSDLLGRSFTVLDLYKHFVDEKFKVFYQEKNKFDLSVEHIFQQVKDEKEAKIKCYKTVAARYYLENLSMTKIIDATFESQLKGFLEIIEKVGDSVGFISQILSDGAPEFSHNSYGEYFAALYLSETDPSKARDKTFMSDGRYNNIRFFLDLMLCKNHKGFIAVIYKNPILLDECEELDLNQIDGIDRDILEVACGHSKDYAYPEKKRSIMRRGNFVKKWVLAKKFKGYLDHTQISAVFHKINKFIDIRIKKLLLFFPFLIPHYEKKDSFNTNYLTVILYYAIRFDFVVIFEYIKCLPELKTVYDGAHFDTILTVAMYSRSQRILEKLFLDERSYHCLSCLSSLDLGPPQRDEILVYILLNVEIKLDVPNSDGEFLTHYACKNKLHKTLKVLNDKEAKWDAADANGRFAIHDACIKGDVIALKSLLDFGCDINIQDTNGNCPIHYAYKHHELKFIEFLIDHGAKVNVPDRDGLFPVHYVCEQGTLARLQLIVGSGAKLDVVATDGRLPIHYAVKNNSYIDRYRILQFLVENGASVNIPDPTYLNETETRGLFPIHSALKCVIERDDSAKLLIDSGANVNVVDPCGKYPIHLACERGFSDVVNELVKYGANLDVLDAQGEFPMHCAVNNDNINLHVADARGLESFYHANEKKYFDIVECLVTNGADVGALDNYAQVLIHPMCKLGHINTVKCLLSKRVDLNVLDASGWLPLHYAIDSGKLDLVNLLIANDAKVHFPDGKAQLLLNRACREGHLDIISFLLENGAEVNVPHIDSQYGRQIDTPDAFGLSPLHCGCCQGDVKVVNLLLSKGADVNISDLNGNRPMHYACLNHHFGPQIMSLLLEKQVDVNVYNKKNHLPIHLACDPINKGHSDLNIKGLYFGGCNISRDAIQFLVEHDAHLHIPDEHGLLPIHYVCKSGALHLVELLVNNGVNVNASDARGRLPIHYACEASFISYDILRFLINKGASINAADVDGVLPRFPEIRSKTKYWYLPR